MSARVPFSDLRTQNEPFKAQLLELFTGFIEESSSIGGLRLTDFEAQFATFCQTQYAVGVASGTASLWLSLLALGVGPGDEVITVPNSFIATAEAISLCGARPVFVDVDERTYTMDPRQLEGAITMRTQAIVPVHLFGQMANMDAILAIARRDGTPVVENSWHSVGAEYKGRKAGSLGVAGCFSFHPSTNLSALGEAGAVVTNELEVRSRIQMLRNHGQASRNVHLTIGWNARMDNLQAAILKFKLQCLEHDNNARRAHATLYDRLLQDEPRVIRPFAAPHNRHVYHNYAVRVQDRDAVMRRMAARGVICAVHYPTPIHLQKAYEFLGLGPGSFPVAERCARELLSLPLYPALTQEQIQTVVTTLKECLTEAVPAAQVS